MFDPVPEFVVKPEKVTALRDIAADYFSILSTAMDSPEPGSVRFRVRPIADIGDKFTELRQRFETYGFTPMLREDENGQTALIGIPHVFKSDDSNWVINLFLFILTIFSTLFIGAIGEEGFTGSELWLGWKFSLSILVILGAHELGHYFAARYHNVPVTLPYFIPMPFSAFGTLGAFIRLKAPVNNKRVLFDIGVAGPLAGLVFAIPILLFGLATSEVAPPSTNGGVLEGNSILYMAAKIAVFGEILPSDTADVFLNQFAWAGWIGLLVTGLNLFPVGQLDGGHVSYVLFGRQTKNFFWPVLIGLVVIMVLTNNYNYAIWAVLLFFFGQTHATPLDDVTPVDPQRRALAIFTFVLFFLVFVPTPLTVISP